MSEWISVKDRTPIGDRAIIIYDGAEIVSGYHCLYRGKSKTTNGIYLIDVTNWQPLPKPPK